MVNIKYGRNLEEIAGNEYRSNGEHKIGNLLDSYELPFVYEKPTLVIDDGKPRIWYPDFTVYGSLIIEYFGLQGDPDYDNGIERKKTVYRENQLDMIPVYPSHFQREWQKYILGSIRTTLENRLQSFNYSSLRGPAQRYISNRNRY